MHLKTIKTKVTYKVPSWNNCNLIGNFAGKPSKEKCRFCVKENGYYRCALYNEVLQTAEGTLIRKTKDCLNATLGAPSVVEEPTTVPDIDPPKIIKAVVKEYTKIYKQLVNQGYPAAIAEKLATEYLTGGGK